MNAMKNSLREILRYPSAVVGLVLILLMFVVAIYAMIAIPYPEAIRLWRGGEEIWYKNPRFAPPAWFNFSHERKCPSHSPSAPATGR
jgi:peptide/nickel transport system permease protein